MSTYGRTQYYVILLLIHVLLYPGTHLYLGSIFTRGTYIMYTIYTLYVDLPTVYHCVSLYHSHHYTSVLLYHCVTLLPLAHPLTTA